MATSIRWPVASRPPPAWAPSTVGSPGRESAALRLWIGRDFHTQLA